jgi:hypothetical protein
MPAVPPNGPFLPSWNAAVMIFGLPGSMATSGSTSVSGSISAVSDGSVSRLMLLTFVIFLNAAPGAVRASDRSARAAAESACAWSRAAARASNACRARTAAWCATLTTAGRGPPGAATAAAGTPTRTPTPIVTTRSNGRRVRTNDHSSLGGGFALI